MENSTQSILHLYEINSNRVSQIDNWRHIQTAFVYGFIIPLIIAPFWSDKFALGYELKFPFFISALFAIYAISTINTLFSIFTIKRILVLANLLFNLEMDNAFPKFQFSSKILYWFHSKNRVKIYLWVANYAFWLQALVLIILSFNLIMYLKEPWGWIVFSILPFLTIMVMFIVKIIWTKDERLNIKDSIERFQKINNE